MSVAAIRSRVAVVAVAYLLICFARTGCQTQPLMGCGKTLCEGAMSQRIRHLRATGGAVLRCARVGICSRTSFSTWGSVQKVSRWTELTTTDRIPQKTADGPRRKSSLRTLVSTCEFRSATRCAQSPNGRRISEFRLRAHLPVAALGGLTLTSSCRSAPRDSGTNGYEDRCARWETAKGVLA